MSTPSLLILVLGSLVNSKSLPFDQFQTSGFSHFDPDTGSFSVGSNTNLYQETQSSNADDFLLSFENVFPGSLTDNTAFNLFAADGGCDDFCQNAFALDAQSQAQFEQDFLAFQSQFGNSLGVNQDEGVSGQAPAPTSPSTTTGNKPQTEKPRIQTQTSQQLPNNNINNQQQPDENFKSNNNNNVQNKNFLFFGNNQEGKNNPAVSTSTTPFTVFKSTTTARPTTTTKRTTTRRTTTRAPESSSKGNTKIKWTFNGKTIGTSTITSKPPTEKKQDNAESSSGESLPISTYFNEDVEDASRQERKWNTDSGDKKDFTVFDAVPN